MVPAFFTVIALVFGTVWHAVEGNYYLLSEGINDLSVAKATLSIVSGAIKKYKLKLGT